MQIQKKSLSFWEMIIINFGFFGIQFGWNLQMANMSVIYKFLGAQSENLGYLWLAAPVTGLLIQPILGQFSDQTWSRLGRRRPYILGGAIVSSIALLLMPNSFSLWMAAILLWVLDGSINISMQPFRALVADVAPTQQHTKCYAIQSCLVGLGATLATVLPWIFLHIFHLSTEHAPGTIPLAIKLSFYIGASIFMIANLITVFLSKEYPPQNIKQWLAAKKERTFTKQILDLKNIIPDFIKMPKIMRQVSFVQFFSWIGMFCFFLFYALGVAQNIFGLPPNATAANNPNYQTLLEQGVALGGLGFATYTFVSFIYAYLIPFVSRLLTRKGAHIFSLVIGGICLFATNFVHSAGALFIAMVGLGIAWASIITLPYAMLASNLPKDKMGLFMGLLNITICVPQIIAALTLGFIVEHFFHGHAMSVVAMAGVFFVIAAFFTLMIQDKN